MKLKHLTLSLMVSSFILSCGNREDEINNELPTPQYYHFINSLPISGNWRNENANIDLKIHPKTQSESSYIEYKYTDSFKHSYIYKKQGENGNKFYYKHNENYYPVTWEYIGGSLVINFTFPYGGMSQAIVEPY